MDTEQCILHQFVSKFLSKITTYDNTQNVLIWLMFNNLFHDGVVGVTPEAPLKLLHYSGKGRVKIKKKGKLSTLCG